MAINIAPSPVVVTLSAPAPTVIVGTTLTPDPAVVSLSAPVIRIHGGLRHPTGTFGMGGVLGWFE